MLTALAATSFTLGVIGFHAAGPAPTDGSVRHWFDAIYRAQQLFFLSFMRPPDMSAGVAAMLEAARFGAFVTTVWAILKAFFPRVRQQVRLWRRWFCPAHAVILGYGPVGQAIGAALWQDRRDIRRITAVQAVVTPDAALKARMDGVLLLEGDPSDARVLDRVFARRALRIFISDTDDLRAIDTAVAVRQQVAGSGGDIRVVLDDSAVAAQMAEAVDTGFLGAAGVRWFSVADETARLLIAEARFDRVAVETGAQRLHLVIIGCGSQGEAVAVEALLTGWRTALAAPRISFVDRHAAAVEARMRRRLPAAFAHPDRAPLPEGAQPGLEFIALDADVLDLAGDPRLGGLRAGVSGWVIATGDDALNLRAGLAVHRAMACRQIDPAPIHVRIPTGHAETMPELGTRPLALARSFGSVDTVIANSSLLDADPDRLPRALHAAYQQARIDMKLPGQPEEWSALRETKRNANRALFRHSAMKLEDFGAEAQAALRGLPVADPRLSQRLEQIDSKLDYMAMDRGTDPAAWLKPGEPLLEGEAETALMVRDAAICEHNRWTAERALAQHVPTATPERALRDDVRRLHNNMHDWFALEDGPVRRFDVVMLRALFARQEGQTVATARPARCCTVFLPISPDGAAMAPVVLAGGAAPTADLTELRVHLGAAVEPQESAALVAALLGRLDLWLGASRAVLPRRVRFDFCRPPGERLLGLANALAEAIGDRHGARIDVAASWQWRAAGGPVVGVFGHRDLSGFGDADRLAETLQQAFMTLVQRSGADALVCGFAPGADQMAVAAWNALGLPLPTLVFPFRTIGPDGATTWHTDDPAAKGPGTAVRDADLKGKGTAVLAAQGSGHAAQADALLAQADVLVAVVDHRRALRAGGARDTLAKARTLRRKVLVMAPPDAA